MLRVYGCITEAHDLRLVVFAGLICVFSCYTALSLVARDQASRGRAWLVASAAVAGCGIWATHFVAMLAFKPNLPVGFHVGTTLLSIVVAVLATLPGFAVMRRGGAASLAGGAMVGAAIGAMHYTGMMALHVPAVEHWDRDLVIASLVIGVALGAIALRVGARLSELRHRAGGAALLALAICGLHFTGMAALSFTPDPTIAVQHQVLSPEWLAVAVAAVAVLIVALAFAGSMVDQHLASRSAAEAERLRAHVVALEATKRELEATAANLTLALDAAAAGSQAKSQFLATMSHELRTPLNAVIGFSEVLAGEAFGPLGNPRYLEYVESIRSSGHHLLSLINDVLDFSKLDANRLDLHEEEVDLHDVVRQATRMIRQQAADNGLRLTERLDPALSVVRIDRRRVLQVVLNLLSNAVKFTPGGGSVEVATFRRDGAIAIAVADTGIGMAADDIPKALERFGQIESTLGRKYGGTGLGLPLAKRLVELHEGTLEIESAPGAGTTATILLPGGRIIDVRDAA